MLNYLQATKVCGSELYELQSNCPAVIQRRILIKLKMLHQVRAKSDLFSAPGTRVLTCVRDGWLCFGIAVNPEICVRFDWKDGLVANIDIPMAIDPDWIENDDAGQILRMEFMEPLGMSAAELAASIAVPPERVERLLDGRQPIDGELDLRLARYFGMSEGFFLGLQNDYELLEAKRALNGELDRITPRAA